MSKRELLLIIFVFIISVGLRIYGLGDRGIWADEKISVLGSNGHNGAPTKKLNTVYFDGKNKTKSFSEVKNATLIQDSGNALMYYVFLSYWTDLFGNSDYSIRFPSFLAGVFFLLIGFLFVKKRFDTNVALFFLISTSIFSLFIIYSQTARSYELALFTTFTSTFIFWEIMDSLKRGINNFKILIYSVVYLLLLGISIFLHYYTFYIFAGHATYLILNHFKEKKTILLFFSVYLIFSICFIFWMLNGGLEGYKLMADRNSWWVQQAKDTGTYFNAIYFIKSFVTFFVAMTGVYVSYIKGFQFYHLLPYIVAFLLIIFLSIKSKPKPNNIVKLFAYTIIIQFAFAISMVLKNGHVLSLSPYYNIFTIPYVLIILAFLSNEILLKGKNVKAVVLFYSVFLTYNLIFLIFYYSKKNIHHSNESNPYVEAAIIIEKQIYPEDTVVSRQLIDGKLISLYTNKSFLFSCNPNLEKDEIYIHKKGATKISILSLEGKRY